MFKRFLRNIYMRKKFPQAQIAGSAKVSLKSTLGKDTRILSGCKIGSCHISRYTYVGARSELTRVNVGPFTSIGAEVICGLGTHPIDFVSTYPGFYSEKASGSTWFGTSQNVVENLPVEIGADVWIGTRVIILGGIKIGHGAIIAAGAVVTKDVPDYAIIGGVPGKLIRYRFDEKIIERLLRSRWWESDDSSLREIAKYINEPEVFLQKLDNIKNAK